MYVRCNPNRKNVKYLSYVQGYRDPHDKVKQITIEKIGDWDDLIKLYDDPIKHFNDLAPQRYKELGLNKNKISHPKDGYNEKLKIGTHPYNIGYAVLKSIYKELGLENFFKNVQKDLNIEYDLNEIFFVLVISRILYPDSKNATFENKEIFFENFDGFSKDDMYRSLDYFCKYKDDIQKLLWNNTKKSYKRDTSKSFYDCTNYYFEIDYNDDDEYEYDENNNVKYDKDGNPIIKEKGLRKRGPEKNHRPDPIVEMGLLMDSTYIPMAYDLFPGNESEKLSLLPLLRKTKQAFNIDRTIVVADRGLNDSDNIIYISGTSLEMSKKMDGYIYGQSVRGADQEFKDWVLEGGYQKDILKDDDGEEKDKDEEDDDKIVFIHKSRIYPKTFYVKRPDKGLTKKGNVKRQKIKIDQKQMVYYSKKYAIKQKREREKMVERAQDLIANPRNYTKATSAGAAGYIKNISFNAETGEVIEKQLYLDNEKIKEEEKYDGYYSIVTSEEELTDIQIRDAYRQLIKIEETFKITKSILDTRPIYVWTKEHIEAHFVTCFVALVMLRLLEKRIDNTYSIKVVLDNLKAMTCSHHYADTYMISTYNEVTKFVTEKFNLNFSDKYMNIYQIKKNF